MRNKILEELLTIAPRDQMEREHLEDAVSWVRSGAEVFRLVKPDTPPKHLVSYFALVDDGYILLVDHRNAQLWLPAGGHVEPGEHPRTTVERELKEELGITLDAPVSAPVMVTCTPTVGITSGHMDVSLWYVVQVDRTKALTFDIGEFHGVQWFRFDDVPLGRSDPHLGRFIEKLTSIST